MPSPHHRVRVVITPSETGTASMARLCGPTPMRPAGPGVTASKGCTIVIVTTHSTHHITHCTRPHRDFLTFSITACIRSSGAAPPTPLPSSAPTPTPSAKQATPVTQTQRRPRPSSTSQLLSHGRNLGLLRSRATAASQTSSRPHASAVPI